MRAAVVLASTVESNTGNVTPTTEIVTMAVIGGVITTIALLITSYFHRSSERTLKAQHEADLQNAREAKAEEMEAIRIGKAEDAARIEASLVAADARETAREDRVNARLDEVARRAEIAAGALLEHQLQEAGVLSAIGTKLVKVEQTTTRTHDIVNSAATQQVRLAKLSKTSQLALLHEVISLKAQPTIEHPDGRQPTAETIAALAALEEEIDAMARDITDREEQQKAAELHNAAQDRIAAHQSSIASDSNPLGVVEALASRVEVLETPTAGI